MANIGTYQRLVAAQFRGETSYRLSFTLTCLSQGISQLIDLVVILVLFSRTSTLGGFSIREVLLMYAFSALGFSLADLVVGSVNRLSTYLRAGTFDVLLMRPLGTLPQLAFTDIQLRKLGKVITSIGLLSYVVATAELDWSWPKTILLIITPLAASIIFGAIFVAACAVAFWLIEGKELANTVTFGSGYFTVYPITVFSDWVRRFLAYLVPGAFVAYYPTLVLMDHPDPLGAPVWLCWMGPIVAILAATIAGYIWKFAVRHYRGTGS